jgi:ferredoxin-NADP reductase
LRLDLLKGISMIAVLTVTPMAQYQTKFLEKKKIAEGTYLFRFVKPVGFLHQPGQFIEILLGDDFEIYPFTLACSPHEPDLQIVTRVRETPFKQKFSSLVPGDTCTIEGPWGNFVLPRDRSLPSVFLGGGIGVTPFLSMIRYLAYVGFGTPTTLFYSSRTPQATPFLDELTTLAENNQDFTFVPSMTRIATSAWNGETGRLSVDLLTKYLIDLPAKEYYIVGSTGFVENLVELLQDAAVPISQIKVEKFTGY